VVDNVPVWVALRPEKIMLCEEPPADGYNFAVGEVVHIAYLGDLSIYHVRLKSGQMLSAQLQNEHRYRKGRRPGVTKCACAGMPTAASC
jgi:putrescine transport system ATP-binding protein